MSARVRQRTIAAATPQEKLAWAEDRLVRLRASAADAMRALMSELEEAATRLEAAVEQPEARDELTRFADRAERIDRLSLDILYTRQLAAELRAAHAAASLPSAPHVARVSRPVAAPPVDPAAAGSAGVSQADIDALIKARAKAS